MDFGFCFSFPLFRIHVQSFQLQMGVPFFVLFLSMILNVLQYNKQQQLKHFTFWFVCGTFKFESMCVDTSINASEMKKNRRENLVLYIHISEIRLNVCKKKKLPLERSMTVYFSVSCGIIGWNAKIAALKRLYAISNFRRKIGFFVAPDHI